MGKQYDFWCVPKIRHFFLNLFHSFFLGELEKCLEDPDRLASLFVKQASYSYLPIVRI